MVVLGRWPMTLASDDDINNNNPTAPLCLAHQPGSKVSPGRCHKARGGVKVGLRLGRARPRQILPLRRSRRLPLTTARQPPAQASPIPSQSRAATADAQKRCPCSVDVLSPTCGACPERTLCASLPRSCLKPVGELGDRYVALFA